MTLLVLEGADTTRLTEIIREAGLPAPRVVASLVDAPDDAVVLGVGEPRGPCFIALDWSPSPERRRAAFEAGAVDYVPHDEPDRLKRAVQREFESATARAEVKKARQLSARTTAMYQQRALQMEIIRQQNEDLDRLARDLAKSKKLEEERARELETAARLKGEFLANFSHEIRTPLNGILGYCDLLTREEGGRLTPHGRRDLGVIKSNARTLLALINDILDLSKIESGNIDVVMEKVEVLTLLEECAATVREHLKGKSVELTTRVSPDAAVITTDSLKMRQVLLNLLTNAAKFTEAGEIAIDISRAGDAAIITVEDTGTGIPADQLPFIFEKFRQVNGTTTRKVGGTGLGLAIVRELARLLGGTVEVWSELGRGSRFTLTFPTMFEGKGSAQPPKLTESVPVQNEPSSSASDIVLVVDDDAPTRQLLQGELEKEGFRVLLAVDGVEALRLLGEQRPGAIVLDIHLPRLDGWSVLARIKADPKLSQVPVVIISVEEARARGFALGASEYLVKPFEPDRLVAAVSAVVSPLFGDVLVVDDDAGTRELVSRNLRRAGFSTAEAKNGQEALLRLRTTRPAALILDLVMPGLDGFEVLRTMRAERNETPVIVLTGKTLSPSEHATLTEGIATILHKDAESVAKVLAETKRLVLKWQRAAKGRTRRVLYVEDSAQNRDLVRRYLRGVYELFEAEDGEEALERVRQSPPDLILMDLSLPRVDGYEATRRIKAAPDLAQIPVLALTAHASREDEARARAAGCTDFLTKPISQDDLLAAIRRHLPGAP